MAATLFSPLWYRVADCLPRLPPGVSVRHQRYRGEAWHVLISATTGRQYRINRRAYQFIGRCDGHQSVQRIWDDLLESLRDAAPTQEEIIQLMTRLADEGLMDYGSTPDFTRQRDRRRRRDRRGFPNPLAFRVPLGDPSALLGRLDGLASFLLRPAIAWLWLCAVVLAGLTAASEWAALAQHASQHLGTPRHLFLAWCAFPCIKALHEMGHALAVRHWGGEVHEAGIGLFFLTPAPYVDASASAGFRRRRHRGAVAAMGVMVELAIAALALAVWMNIQPGLVRDLAFVTLFIASVSTLAFNGNPLMQFDAYHVLCDALDLPNLAPRSRRYWVHLLQRAVFGADHAVPMHLSAGERRWLIAYAPLSWLFRLTVAAAIVLWVGGWSATLGVVIAAYSAITFIAMPAFGLARDLVRSAPDPARRSRTARAAVALALALALACFAVPLPFHTAAPGVVWLPDEARARAGTDGFITAFAASDGETVSPGQLLLTIEDPALQAEHDRLQGRLRALQANRFDALVSDGVKAGNVEAEMARVQGELAQVDVRIGDLEVRSRIAGTFVMPRQADLLGTFVARGTTLGVVLDRSTIGVRAAVPERDAALIREGSRAVEVRLAEDADATFAARLVRDIPAATNDLPSAALGDRGGGPYATDPSDESGLRSAEPVVLIDLAVTGDIPERVGGRVWVRFDHGSEPLAVQWWRRMRQLFLQQFSTNG